MAGDPPPFEPEPIALGMNETSFAYLLRTAPRHDRMFQVRSLLGEIQFVVRHPDEVRHVLHASARNYRKGRSFRNMKMLMGNGLVVQDGAFWRQQRKMMQPLFHERTLAELARIMRARADRVADAWSERAGEVIDLSGDLSRATLDIVLEALFSEDVPALRGPFALLTEETARTYKFVPLFRKLLDHVFEVIASREQERRAPPDLLTLLCTARNGDGEPMAAAQIVDEVATLIIAGHETSASVLALAWQLLGTHPAIERRFHDAVDGAAAEGALVQNVIFETMRLYPPGWIVDRQAEADDVVAGFAVPAGTQLFVPIYSLHHDPRFFPDPEVFRPDRFVDYPVDPRYRRGQTVEESTYAFIPFGTGPRRCVGDQFALLNAETHLAAIGRRLRVIPVSPPATIELAAGVNLRPRYDFRATVTPRRG